MATLGLPQLEGLVVVQSGARGDRETANVPAGMRPR